MNIQGHREHRGTLGLGFIIRDKSLDRSAATSRLLRWVSQGIRSVVTQSSQSSSRKATLPHRVDSISYRIASLSQPTIRLAMTFVILVFTPTQRFTSVTLWFKKGFDFIDSLFLCLPSSLPLCCSVPSVVQSIYLFR